MNISAMLKVVTICVTCVIVSDVSAMNIFEQITQMPSQYAIPVFGALVGGVGSYVGYKWGRHTERSTLAVVYAQHKINNDPNLNHLDERALERFTWGLVIQEMNNLADLETKIKLPWSERFKLMSPLVTAKEMCL